MGIFKKNKIDYEKYCAKYYSGPSMKDTMKMAGLIPTENTRELFGWTEEDDAEAVEELKFKVSERKEILNELKASGATLRKIMEVEISIKGSENWLKANNHI